jgi:hypothetical protein
MGRDIPHLFVILRISSWPRMLCWREQVNRVVLSEEILNVLWAVWSHLSLQVKPSLPWWQVDLGSYNMQIFWALHSIEIIVESSGLKISFTGPFGQPCWYYQTWCLWCYSECISTPGKLEKYAWPRWESNLRPLGCGYTLRVYIHSE